MNTKNKVGPRMLPCGSPVFRNCGVHQWRGGEIFLRRISVPMAEVNIFLENFFKEPFLGDFREISLGNAFQLLGEDTQFFPEIASLSYLPHKKRNCGKYVSSILKKNHFGRKLQQTKIVLTEFCTRLYCIYIQFFHPFYDFAKSQINHVQDFIVYSDICSDQQFFLEML